MRKFFYNIGLFSIPLVLLFFCIELNIRNVKNEYSSKKRYFENTLNDLEVLILGSSHGLRAINPHKFEYLNTYNMAMISQPVRIDRDIILKFEHEMPKLRALIITISYFSLTRGVHAENLKNRLNYYRIFYGLDYYENNILSLVNLSLASTVGWRSSLKLFLYKSIGMKRTTQTDSTGWMGEGGIKNKTKSDFLKDATAAVKRHENGKMDFHKQIENLKDILLLAEDRKLEVVFICTPKSKYYTSKLSTKKVNKIDETINNLVDENPNYHYLNYRNSDLFNISHFRNSDHLNKKGADKFTNMLEDFLNKKLIVPNSQNNNL